MSMGKKGNDHKLDRMDINVPRFGSVTMKRTKNMIVADSGVVSTMRSSGYGVWVLFVL